MRTVAVDLAAGAGLAALAGATDVYGLAALHDLYVSFMSGNTTMLGVALAAGNGPRTALIASVIGMFVAGAAGGGALQVLGGQRHAALVAAATAVALALPLAWPFLLVPALTVGMGMVNASMTRLGNAPVSLTYVTGTLVRFGQGLGGALCGRPGDWSWLWQLPMWASLVAGAVLGRLVQQRLGQDAVWPLSAWAALIAGLMAMRRPA